MADWRQFINEITVDYIEETSETIGVVGKIVEIDESKFEKRKYNRGHRVEGQWVFGGVERGSNMRLKRHFIQRYPLLFVCFVFCGVLVVFCFQYELNGKISFQFIADDTVTDFLIDTPSCQIPAWDPWDDSVKDLFKKVISPYKCSGQPSFLRILPNGVVTVEDALLQYYYEVEPQNVSCVYQEIQRNAITIDENVDNRVSLSASKALPFDQPLEIDFLKTICRLGDPYQDFVEFLPITPLKREVEKRCVSRNSKIKVQKPLNVIFLGLDSISHLNFIRHFPKSQKYLTDFLSPITMQGYTKVGDNTFPNLVPLLTGHFYQHYYDEVNNKKMAYKHPPTDYYYRPFALAVEKSDLKAKSKGQCFGSKMEMEVIYDYLKSFTDTMGQNRPFFAFLFLARLTHDVFNFAGYADEPTFQLLKYLDESKILNNTMLLFFSDHGIRFGRIRKTRIGQYEERMPFMHLILPKWFLDDHTIIRKNLETNAKRLTTPFDIHATLCHLASLMSGDIQCDSKLKPGISLFREVPSNRTCSDAGITPHWCTCQVSKPISTDESRVQKAADTVIHTINKWTGIYQAKCAILTLNQILNARVTASGQIGDTNLTNNKETFSKSFLNYLIVVSASPSKAVFEATVRCEVLKEGQCEVLDDISRITSNSCLAWSTRVRLWRCSPSTLHRTTSSRRVILLVFAIGILSIAPAWDACS
ncbi:uncharacterized protein NPIL_644831 [Nephila pilipes]|uniref:Uncharacterized protein n=1 Tax=Nephila pilipes TaxID=299642 RepID=A0A8X6NBA3_NEPPI|nr:uncharacterized protein NPIL_644831 [Nephila pilipes]